ncbi:hypothetical protein [Candidatus Allofournierella merdipullorum]|uniref:hypothetical protein n=1 Tax=Candidatus Allofournierella merdipullorum TaxID=2838595 RepID=UPI002A847113|nr:hypothetical protein [Candidatus Fournierella merdipullorum]
MPAILSLVLVAAAAVLCWKLAKQLEAKRQKKASGGDGCLEYRTPLAFDECLDALAARGEQDEFEYECARQPDGSFLLHFTLHKPTGQPVDTLYALRLDAGKQTVVTLHFLREAFGCREPVFPKDLLDAFLSRKLNAVPRQQEAGEL